MTRRILGNTYLYIGAELVEPALRATMKEDGDNHIRQDSLIWSSR